MILFAAPEFAAGADPLRESVADLSAGDLRAGRFENGELFIQLDTPVAGEFCLIPGSIAPPEAGIGRECARKATQSEGGMIVLAIRKPDGRMIFNPPGGTPVLEGDVLIVMGEKPGLRNLETILSEAGVPR